MAEDDPMGLIFTIVTIVNLGTLEMEQECQILVGNPCSQSVPCFYHSELVGRRSGDDVGQWQCWCKTTVSLVQ